MDELITVSKSYLEALEIEAEHMSKFIDLVYEVYPNVDLDVAIYTKYKDVS